MIFDIQLSDNSVWEGIESDSSTLPKEYAFILADDKTPPESLKDPKTGIPLTDVELKQRPDLWFWKWWREHRRGPEDVNNLPATCVTLKKSSFVHDEFYLEYWANNCALAWYDVYSWKDIPEEYMQDFVGKWLWLTKGSEVITNGRGWNNGYYDPITGMYEGSIPIGIDALCMERNIIHIVDSALIKLGGMRGFVFETLNADVAPPDVREINYRTHPWFFHRANIAMSPTQRNPEGGKVVYRPNGNMGLDPFPHGWDGNLQSHTPLPVISETTTQLPGGVNLIPENRVHLTNGEVTLIDYVPNHYNPKRTLR